MSMEPAADATRCPACGKAIDPAAVLCIGCGYHLKLGYHLSTAVENGSLAQAPLTPNANPYAASISDSGELDGEPREQIVFDLTESGVRWAQGVAGDAKYVVWVVILSLACVPLGMLMFPWYAFRIFCWHRLNAQFSELRNPNSFSPHGVLAADFQEANGPLWIGVAAGLVYWVLVGLTLLMRTRGVW